MGGTVHRLTAILVFALLLCASLATAAKPDLRLVTAVATQDTQTVLALLDEGVDVNASRADGVTALLWAAHWDDLDVTDRLLRAGANVDAADDHGVTPLARASENRSVAMVTKLLEAGADANAAQTSGLTPLMIASRTGSVAVVEALLLHGADVNTATAETQSTALMWAVGEPHPDIARVLLDAQADPRASTAKGFTTLMYAARNGDIPTAEALIAAGVNINELSADGTHCVAVRDRERPGCVRDVPARAGRRPQWNDGRRAGVARGSGQRRDLAWRLVPAAWTWWCVRLVLPQRSQSGKPAHAGQRIAGAGRRPERAHDVVRDDHELHRLPEEGRVRNVRLRHR